MMTRNQNLKRGHFTADKTLTSLQRLPFKKEKKKNKKGTVCWGSVVWRNILLLQNEIRNIQKAPNVVNLWMYQSVLKQPKGIKKKMHLFRYISWFIFWLLPRTEKAIKCNRKIVLIGWSYDNLHSTVFSCSFHWIIIIQHKNAEFCTTFWAVSAWFWALPWLGLPWPLLSWIFEFI